MGWWLAGADDAQATDVITRFDPVYWTVNFPRPMMASVVTSAPDALRVDAVFYRADDLAGLIWASADEADHPLLRYATRRDYRDCTLGFRWRSAGVKPLDTVNGPVLTIEGRDESGAPRTWYVRLWNYAEGAPEDAIVTIDFGALDGGWTLPGEADPVWAGDIDRMFISLAPGGAAAAGTVLAAPREGWAELSAIRCDGPGSVLTIGAARVPEHGLKIATGYDDLYHLTPARLLRNMLHLGYRGLITHYVGMSHYFRLEWNAGAAGFFVSLAGGVLNGPCARWHGELIERAKTLGYELILSLSYELLDQHVWGDWKQRAADGSPALTGWVPPSTLLSPAHTGAMGYLRQVGAAFAGLAVAAGQRVRFQIGEPWWWVTGEGKPCLYDDAARAALGGNPVAIPDVRAPLSAPQKALLDQAGAVLAASTAGLRDAVRGLAADAEIALLIYLPGVLDRAAPEIKRANVPIGWAAPAYDVLQLEDYDWVTAGQSAITAAGIAAATARLGYPIEAQQYFAGFVLRPEQAPLWRAIDAAADAGRARGTAAVFLWALPQILRDGFVHFDIGEPAVDAFDDVAFPLGVGRDARVEPGFSTAIVTTASGHEQRNADWGDARMRYDAGPGIRSEADMQALIGFFRARRGAAKGFRFRDPYDDSSNGMTGTPGAADQPIGTGDGSTTIFALVKLYGAGGEALVRRITRPLGGSVRVSVGGSERLTGWTLLPGGAIGFDTPPAAGASIAAGYRFDVPVRFETDRLEVSRAGFLAGEAVSVPLVEIREG